MRNEYNNRLRFYPAHCHSRLNLFCRAGQEREKSAQCTVIHCVTSYEKGQVLSPALSCLQKILHCLIYPGIFEIVEQKKRLPEGNLFMERKTRLERRLTCACHLRSPLSRLRRQLPRGAVASPSPAVHTSKQKRDYPKVISLWSGKRDSNSRPQPWQGCALPTELFPQNFRKNCHSSEWGLQR